LRGRGLPEVCIINPHRTKAFGDSLGIRNKTDRIDCAVIALFALSHRPAPVQSGSAAEEQLRELTRLRQSYDRDLTAWKNRLGQADNKIPRRCVEQTIGHLQKQIEELDKAIEALVQGDGVLNEQVRNLKKIRCVKQVVATTLTAELGDLRTYDRGEIVAKAGLFATKFESGSSVRRPGRLAKRGGAPVRRALYMAATSVWNSKGALRQYADRLEKRGMKRIQINMALMRKLLLICRAVAINGGLYDESLILQGVPS
jgi:transposase